MTPERQHKILSVLHKRQPNLTVIMENIQDPRNITAVMRTCESVGIQAIHVITTKVPRFKKFEFKSGMSAFKWMQVHQYTSIESCVHLLQQQGFSLFTTHLNTKAVSVYEMDFTQKIALVFGNEHNGVSEELNAMANGNFIIPQVGMIQSLNISVACAVTLYEAFRQKQLAGHYNTNQLSQQEVATILSNWGIEDINNKQWE
jgi:tRNA (guanosine-2'-O-)-methyltransferase